MKKTIEIMKNLAFLSGKDNHEECIDAINNSIIALETLEKIKAIITEEEHFEVSNSFTNPRPSQADYDAVSADKFHRIWKLVAEAEKQSKAIYAIAKCDIIALETEYAVAVRKENKQTAEMLMQKAYDCWSSCDEDACILGGFDADTICQTCYGDFIDLWLKESGIAFNEDLGLIPLNGYCCENPSADEEYECVSDWRDERNMTYWFIKEELVEYLESVGETLEHYMKFSTPDDVDCDILGNVEYAIKEITLK